MPIPRVMVRDDSTGPLELPSSSTTERLARIARVLADRPPARTPLADDIQAQLDAGTYQNEERLNLAIYRMLREVLG